MYQSQFGLSRRPFSSTPDPTCVVPVGGMPEALSELEHCAQDGQGIGILTAPAGMGKTLLCRKLAESLRDQFAVVFLPNANFPTRRSLLQAMLYEMGHPYLRLGEQELRLEFTTAVRDLHPEREGLVVIVDEAHLLHNRLLEELRTATHLIHEGELLVRIVLSGQLELEERLVKKDLAAINQRIVCHVTLSPLTMLESQEYLEQRIEWAGGTLSDIFEPDAVRMICQASDGNARCLNQLADHTLLLARAQNQAQAAPMQVMDALEELKQLPLHWNHVELPQSPGGGASRVAESVAEPPEISTDSEEDPQTACIEFGAPGEEEQSADTEGKLQDNEPETPQPLTEDVSSEAEGEIEITWDEEEDLGEAKPDLNFTEEVVFDHYARLDNGLPPEIVEQKPRDWESWDPVEELRAEEARFAASPFPGDDPDVTIIHPVPEAGGEWQPEDLDLPRRPPVTSDPSDLIDRVMPLIDAALHTTDVEELEEFVETNLQSRFLKDLEDSPPKLAPDSFGEPFLAEASLAGDWDGPAGIEEINLLINELVPLAPGNPATESQEYLLSPQSDAGSNDLEEQIAQTVLDTYHDVQPLIWDSATDKEPAAETELPPVAAGEEPIRDPGDSTAYDELRDSLQQAVDATQPADEPPASTDAAPNANPQPPRREYDIVLPEPEEETPPSAESQAGSRDSQETAPTQRPRTTRNLFSKIRRKEQA